MTTNFEAKLHGFRRTQDGVVVSYVVHPSDVSTELATAALGTRYMVAVAEIGDDEQPVQSPVDQRIDRQVPNLKAEGSNPSGAATKEKRPFASLPLSQQAALRCQDNDFKLFMNASNADDAAHWVRRRCDIESRAELDDLKNMAAREAWFGLEDQFQAWLVTRQYADSRR